jgi:uncharacterized protein YdhG (YjbR/CyaY superfamily)
MLPLFIIIPHNFGNEDGVFVCRGSVQFPLAEPMPYELMKVMVLFRAQQNKGSY